MSKDTFEINLQQVKKQAEELERAKDKLAEHDKLIDELKRKKGISRKKILKFIKDNNDPYFLETLIINAETRKRQLKPGFQSETPRG